jgi:DNA-binding transcriptional LysR family regulator
MTLRQLQIFIVVANRLNLRAAAQELHISPPSISEQLRLLQEEFGTHLHRKVGSGIELTAAGVLFLKEAKAIIAQIKNLKAKLGKDLAPIEPSLTIGGCYSAANELLPSLLSLFKKRHLNVQLNLRTGNRSDLEQMVLSGDGDLAVVHELPSSAKVAAELFDTDPVIAFVGINHPLANKRRLDWNDLGRFGFVVRGPRTGPGIIHRYCRNLVKKKAKIRVIMQCNSPAAVKTAVAQNAAIGILFKGSIESDINKGQFKQIQLPGETVESKRYVIYHKMRPLSPSTKEFIELLRTHRDKMHIQRKARKNSAQGKP